MAAMSKQRSSDMNTFNRQSESEVVTAIKIPPIGGSDAGGSTRQINEREEQHEGEDRYDVRAAFEKEHKGECLLLY